MLFVEKLYSELDKEGRLTLPESRTVAFFLFNHNIGRALMLPTLRYGPETDNDWAVLDSAFLHQAAIIQIITSLEAYYQTILRTIAENTRISQVNAVALSRFMKSNRLMIEFTRALEDNRTLDFYLSELIPQLFTLQQKDKIRTVMQLVDLDPIGSHDQEWARTFGDYEESIVNLRHAFAHRGIDYTKIFKFDIVFIKERIKDAIVLVGNLEMQINKKYPAKRIKELYIKKPSVARAKNK